MSEGTRTASGDPRNPSVAGLLLSRIDIREEMIMNIAFRSALLLALALAALGCDFLEYGPGGNTAEAESRVLHVLASMQKAGDTTGLEIQEGLCRWYNGKRLIGDALAFDEAVTGFDRWRRERNVYNRKIASYEITGSTEVPDSDPPAVIVDVTIEGKAHQIMVPEDSPMSWHGPAPR